MDSLEFGQGIRRRDPMVWDVVGRRCGAALRRHASLRLPRDLDPEDAVGTVWLRGLRDAPRFDASRPVLPWLLGICTRVCFEARRKRARVMEAQRRAIQPPQATTHEGLPTESCAALARAVDALPPRERIVVLLRYLQGQSTSEIAEILEIKPGTVHVTLRRGLKDLRRGPLSHELRP